MNLATKLEDQPTICQIYIGFSNELELLNQVDLAQNFFDASPSGNFEKIYVSKSKTSFSEQSTTTRAGDSFTQRLRLSMPISSYKRTEKVRHLMKTKFLLIELSNKRFLFFGQNDEQQNKKISVRFSSDERTANFEFTNRSIFPIGYAFLEGYGFPYLIPSTL